MDNIDLKILKLQKKNARITASDISSNINLSVSAVSDRLKKLESSGIIEQYTTIINPRYLNKDLTVIMFVALEGPKYTDKFIELVLEEDEILDCHYLAGEYDYALKIMTENTDTLETILNHIKGIEGVAKTKTTVVLSTKKHVHSIFPSKKL